MCSDTEEFQKHDGKAKEADYELCVVWFHSHDMLGKAPLY